MDLSKRKEIQDALMKKGATLPCSRCGHNSFGIVEEYGRLSLQKDFKTVVLGGPAIPCAVVACNNCGNISLHALAALGLMSSAAAVPAPIPPDGPSEPKPPERSAQ